MRAHVAEVVVWLAILLCAGFFSWLAILRHQTLGSSAMDLGYTDQIVWNTLHGRFLRFTTLENASIDLPLDRFRRTDILLAYHVELLLVPISLLYLIWSSPMALLVLQAVEVSLGAWPAYLLARRHLHNGWAGICFALAYLLAPALEGAMLSDFHAVSLTACLLMWAMYLIHERRLAAFMAVAGVAMLAKEDISLLVIAIGLYLFLWKRERRGGLLVMGMGAVWFLVCMQIILPHYNGLSGSPFLHRLAIFGPTLRESLENLRGRPSLLLEWMAKPEIRTYVQGLLQSVGYMPVLYPPVLAIAAPSLAINVFSTWGWTYSEGEHYSVAIMPFLIAAGIYGMGFLSGKLSGRFDVRRGQMAGWLALGMLIVSGIHHQRVGISPLSRNYNPPRVTRHHRLAAEFLERIPPDASVSAQSNLYPHLSQREQAYFFPAINDAEYVFLDVTSTSYPLTVQHLYLNARHLLRFGEYGVLAAKDGYLLLQRGIPPLLSGELDDAFYTFVHPEPAPSHALQVRFGEALELVGYDCEALNLVQAQHRVATVRTCWRALRPLELNYQFAFFFTRADGAIVFACDGGTPTSWWYPAYEWRVGEIVCMETPIVTVDRRGDALVAVAPPAKDIWAAELRLEPRVLQGGVDHPIGAPGGTGILADRGTLVRLCSFAHR
ncbi:MAG: DUF2079 domain-containing protein [Anaerolineae bacterium]|nr:DUF2079 domain-containing protein [Anaerolineae bacterium]